MPCFSLSGFNPDSTASNSFLSAKKKCGNDMNIGVPAHLNKSIVPAGGHSFSARQKHGFLLISSLKSASYRWTGMPLYLVFERYVMANDRQILGSKPTRSTYKQNGYFKRYRAIGQNNLWFVSNLNEPHSPSLWFNIDGKTVESVPWYALHSSSSHVFISIFNGDKLHYFMNGGKWRWCGEKQRMSI